jgi:dTDP-4-amino-4,6-dideoxygalactose transaminase
MSGMKFIDLAAQQQRIREEVEARMRAVLDHGQYILGPEIGELERALAGYTAVKHAIGCASGTDALLLALLAHGVGPGDAIITTPFTFMATAEVIALLHATPVFVDIDPVTFNMDPERLEPAIEALIAGNSSLHPLPLGMDVSGLRPRGIIAVDLFGLPADYVRINGVARKYGLFVIQDAAQSFGGEHAGKKACGMAGVACTSFFPAKPLGGYGDGGMCFTDDDAQAEVMRSLCVHGQGRDKYDNVRIGINGRLDTLQAAILIAKFGIFQEELILRQEVADRYTRLLKDEASPLVPPVIPEGYLSAWAQYSVLTKESASRATLLENLKKSGIPTAIYYPVPLHMQTAFRYLGYRAGDMPVSEECARRIFSLPMHPYLKREDQERIVEALVEVR